MKSGLRRNCGGSPAQWVAHDFHFQLLQPLLRQNRGAARATARVRPGFPDETVEPSHSKRETGTKVGGLGLAPSSAQRWTKRSNASPTTQHSFDSCEVKTRRAILNRFPYAVYFRVTDKDIENSRCSYRVSSVPRPDSTQRTPRHENVAAKHIGLALQRGTWIAERRRCGARAPGFALAAVRTPSLALAVITTPFGVLCEA